MIQFFISKTMQLLQKFYGVFNLFKRRSNKLRLALGKIRGDVRIGQRVSQRSRVRRHRQPAFFVHPQRLLLQPVQSFRQNIALQFKEPQYFINLPWNHKLFSHRAQLVMSNSSSVIYVLNPVPFFKRYNDTPDKITVNVTSMTTLKPTSTSETPKNP